MAFLRKALLIESSNVGDGPPLSSKRDIELVSTWLRSEAGGAWEEKEITFMSHPTSVALALRFMFYGKIDYMFVYFSGHGFNDGVDKIDISNGQTYEVMNFTHLSMRSTIIIDACRTKPEEIEDEQLLIKASADLLVEQERERAYYQQRFQEEVLNAPPGHVFLFACSPREGAVDTGSGGLFTRSLIHMANSYSRNPGSPVILPIHQVFQQASTVVVAEEAEQNPRLEFLGQNTGQYPFGVK